MQSNHDPARRRRSVRKGRERGCWVYIPGEQVEAAGIATERGSEPPFYRVWSGRKRTLLVQLYTEA